MDIREEKGTRVQNRAQRARGFGGDPQEKKKEKGEGRGCANDY